MLILILNIHYSCYSLPRYDLVCGCCFFQEPERSSVCTEVNGRTEDPYLGRFTAKGRPSEARKVQVIVVVYV